MRQDDEKRLCGAQAARHNLGLVKEVYQAMDDQTVCDPGKRMSHQIEPAPI